MKRRRRRIHYKERTQRIKRVRRREVRWDVVLLLLLAAVMIAVGVYAVYRWISVNGAV